MQGKSMYNTNTLLNFHDIVTGCSMFMDTVCSCIYANASLPNAGQSDNNNSMLHRWLSSALSGNIYEIQNMLHFGADVDMKQNNGIAALHITAYKGYTALTKLLLSSHAQINVQAADGTVPLFCAAQENHSEL